MIDGLQAVILDQILLADIGDIARFAIFGEQMVERLVAVGPDVRRNRFEPFFGIRENGIDIENDAAEPEQTVLYDITDAKACVRNRRCIAGGKRSERIYAVHDLYVVAPDTQARKMATGLLGKATFIR